MLLIVTFGCQYLKDEESAIIAFKFHKSKDFLHGQCSENVCFDANGKLWRFSCWGWMIGLTFQYRTEQ